MKEPKDLSKIRDELAEAFKLKQDYYDRNTMGYGFVNGFDAAIELLRPVVNETGCMGCIIARVEGYTMCGDCASE